MVAYSSFMALAKSCSQFDMSGGEKRSDVNKDSTHIIELRLCLSASVVLHEFI